MEATRKDEVINKIEVGNITELNDFWCCSGHRNVRSQEKKKHMNGTMVEKENGSTSKRFKKTLGHINTLIERKNIKKKHKDGLERRYKLKRRGLPVTREEVKEIIKAKNNEIKRYQSRINQY